MPPQVHDHTFGQDLPRPGERRTVIVIALTAITMVVEIVAGLAFGSMALLADGLHMASHAAALGLAAFAYVYARSHARDQRFSFGTGKVNALAGFSGAVVLVGFAAVMLVESIGRLMSPVTISFNQAITVAVVGLAVNALSVLVLGGHHEGRDHDHHHGHGHRDQHDHHDGHDAHEDHNLRSAYLHVLADALTSVLAMAALLAGKYWGATWLDPLMGVAGAFLVIRWARGLLRQTARVLLDRQAPDAMKAAVRTALEEQGRNRVYDLHIWSIGPGIHAAEVAVETGSDHGPDYFRNLLPPRPRLVHVTVEISRSGAGSAEDAARSRDSQPAGDRGRA